DRDDSAYIWELPVGHAERETLTVSKTCRSQKGSSTNSTKYLFML
ncbi:6462_t:CDS:1, partial [Racocetra persica]